MINTAGAITVMDRGITLNWEDGPTLHHITARVRYHSDAEASPLVVLVQPSQRSDDVPFTFEQDTDLHVAWKWQDGTEPYDDDDDGATYWTARVTVTNTSKEEVFIDDVDVLVVESANSGQLNLGAPVASWRCALEAPGTLSWQPVLDEGNSSSTVKRDKVMLVQPTVSNRTHPPALLIVALNTSQLDGTPVPDSELKLACKDGRFESIVGVNHYPGVPLPPGAILASGVFLISSGDDTEELKRTYANTETG